MQAAAKLKHVGASMSLGGKISHFTRGPFHHGTQGQRGGGRGGSGVGGKETQDGLLGYMFDCRGVHVQLVGWFKHVPGQGKVSLLVGGMFAGHG